MFVCSFFNTLHSSILGGKKYHVRVEPKTVFKYYLHEDWRSVIFEQISSFEVNGIKGYGLFEFLYRFVWSCFFKCLDMICAVLLKSLLFVNHEPGISLGQLTLNLQAVP
jgi:hypothetical protein